MFVLDAVQPMALRNPIEVVRWTRFRHDRAYVRVHGDHVGFRDLVTGEVRAATKDDVELVARVTADLQRQVDLSYA